MVWIPLVTCCSCCRSCPNWEKILPRNNWFRCSPGPKTFPSIANSNNFNRFELLMGALFFIPHGGLWSAYVFLSGHTNTPCIGLFSYTGGVLSIVRFYWFASIQPGLFILFRFFFLLHFTATSSHLASSDSCPHRDTSPGWWTFH